MISTSIAFPERVFLNISVANRASKIFEKYLNETKKQQSLIMLHRPVPITAIITLDSFSVTSFMSSITTSISTVFFTANRGSTPGIWKYVPASRRTLHIRSGITLHIRLYCLIRATVHYFHISEFQVKHGKHSENSLYNYLRNQNLNFHFDCRQTRPSTTVREIVNAALRHRKILSCSRQ